jgi:hypothetical protein
MWRVKDGVGTGLQKDYLLINYDVHWVALKPAQTAAKFKEKRNANHLYPLRDGSEKTKPFAGRARPTK